LARGSPASETCASPGVKNGGELSKYPSTGLHLAGGKWHGTMPSWGMKWATPRKEEIYIALIVERMGGAGVRVPLV
jgi:hypothetical protein